MDTAYTILIADDDPDDQKIVSDALSRAIPEAKIMIVGNGNELLDTCRQTVVLPDLIIADIQMPQLTGLEALALLKQEPAFCQIPCVILSTSKEPSDIEQARELGAALYITKPLLFSEWVTAMQRIKSLLLA